jgi:DNA (cytosine-5)-methyltransferase 1
MTFRYLSICSGIEAATEAVHPLGWHPVGFAEIDPFASAVLAHHHGSNMPGEPLARNGVPNHGDFTAMDLSQIGQVDVLVGGTPCQAFSIAGRRMSLADARGNLTLAFVVLAHELAGSHGLRNAWWENVPGVLSTDDNAFGCFLGALVGADAPLLPSPEPAGKRGNEHWSWSDEINALRPRWPGVGMVAGSAGRAAWRVLDAQYFGLAQRRERVFVVADFGAGADPAAVLFERQGLRGHPPARGEARQGAARDAAAGAGVRGAVGFGGGRVSGPVEVGACLAANGGGQAMDFETETFLVETAPTLPSRSTAGGGLGTDHDLDGGLIAHALRGEGFDASEGGTGRGTPIVPVLARTLTRGAESAGKGGYAGRRREDDDNLVVTAFDARQSDVLVYGDMTGPLDTKFPGPAAAFAIQERAVSENPDAGPDGMGVREGVAYTLEARENVQAVAFDMRGREGGAQFEGPHETANLRAASGGSSRSYVATQWAVRRLTPLECSRLQGFPDDHARIPWRGKPAELCPDGPQYKTYGNSMAVNVMAWIGARLDAELKKGTP